MEASFGEMAFMAAAAGKTFILPASDPIPVLFDVPRGATSAAIA
jgi:hypothetical protein